MAGNLALLFVTAAALVGVAFAGIRPGFRGPECLPDWREFRGYCYLLIGAGPGEGLSQEAARAACNELKPAWKDAWLASILWDEENAFVADVVAGGRRAWIGAVKPAGGDTFSWQEDELRPLVYTNWNYRQPSFGEGEDCVEINRSLRESGKWNDLPCRRRLPAVCEYDLRF